MPSIILTDLTATDPNPGIAPLPVNYVMLYGNQTMPHAGKDQQMAMMNISTQQLAQAAYWLLVTQADFDHYMQVMLDNLGQNVSQVHYQTRTQQ